MYNKPLDCVIVMGQKEGKDFEGTKKRVVVMPYYIITHNAPGTALGVSLHAGEAVQHQGARK